MSRFSTNLKKSTYCNNCIMVCDYNDNTADVFVYAIYYFVQNMICISFKT